MQGVGPGLVDVGLRYFCDRRFDVSLAVGRTLASLMRSPRALCVGLPEWLLLLVSPLAALFCVSVRLKPPVLGSS